MTDDHNGTTNTATDNQEPFPYPAQDAALVWWRNSWYERRACSGGPWWLNWGLFVLALLVAGALLGLVLVEMTNVSPWGRLMTGAIVGMLLFLEWDGRWPLLPRGR